MKKSIDKKNAILFFILSITYSYGQDNGLRSFIQQSDKILEIISKKKTRLVRAEYDFIYKSGKKTSWRILSKDTKYLIFAFGDKRIADLDIAIYEYKNKKWIKIKKDSREDNSASIKFTPKETKEYKIELSVYKFSEGADFGKYCLLYVLH